MTIPERPTMPGTGREGGVEATEDGLAVPVRLDQIQVRVDGPLSGFAPYARKDVHVLLAEVERLRDIIRRVKHADSLEESFWWILEEAGEA